MTNEMLLLKVLGKLKEAQGFQDQIDAMGFDSSKWIPLGGTPESRKVSSLRLSKKIAIMVAEEKLEHIQKRMIKIQRAQEREQR